jgi:site-specific DNA recombinase
MLGVEGRSINAVKVVFDRERVPTPNGATYWSHKAIRDCVLDDTYKPYSFEELSELVRPEVASRLDGSRSYGVWWFNRRRTRIQQISERGPDGVVYRKKSFATTNPKTDWIAVPVPCSGIPREWVDAARDAIEDNRRTSSAGQRTWTLSGGLFVCGACGRRMAAVTTNRPNGKRYFYYRCPRRVQDGSSACSQAKYHAADNVESGVWNAVRRVLTEPDRLRAGLEHLIEQEGRGLRGNPEGEADAWLEKLAETDRKRNGYIDLAADGIMSREELKAKLAQLDETRRTAERELEALRVRRERLEEMQRDKDALLAHYAALAPEALDALTPEERHRLYGMLRLTVTSSPDGVIELTGALASATDVSSDGITRPSCSSRTQRDQRSAGRSLWAPGSPTQRSRRPRLPP